MSDGGAEPLTAFLTASTATWQDLLPPWRQICGYFYERFRVGLTEAMRLNLNLGNIIPSVGSQAGSKGGS